MEVTLTNELEAFIREKVRSGRYVDASDVVRDALRALEQKEDEFESPELEAELLKSLEGTPVEYSTAMLDRIRQECKAGNEP
jgi:antitoxin ParD1/3/4